MDVPLLAWVCYGAAIWLHEVEGLQMTPDQIIELAKQAGAAKYVNRHYPDRASFGFTQDQLQRFYELVRNEVLEEAAKSCNELIEADNSDDYKAGVTWCAMRIEGLKS